MKKLLTILVGLLSLTPILAATNIWTQVENTGGYSSYQEETWIGGYDWSECSQQMTGYVREGFTNDGEISMNKEVHNDGQWLLEERMTMGGSGDTEIYKYVKAWTEDNRINCCTGKLKYPSEMWVEYSFVDYDTPFTDADTFYAIVDEPPAQHGNEEGNYAFYGKMLETDAEFNFGEKVGIGDFPSDFEGRNPPTFPEMCWFSGE